jgi:hypothetical protein
MRAIIKAALAIRELHQTLLNISDDDGKEIEDYTDAEIVAEAEYVLSTYFENGHFNYDLLIGEFSPGEQRIAKQDVRKLRSLIAKYKKPSKPE